MDEIPLRGFPLESFRANLADERALQKLSFGHMRPLKDHGDVDNGGSADDGPVGGIRLEL